MARIRHRRGHGEISRGTRRGNGAQRIIGTRARRIRCMPQLGDRRVVTHDSSSRSLALHIWSTHGESHLRAAYSCECSLVRSLPSIFVPNRRTDGEGRTTAASFLELAAAAVVVAERTAWCFFHSSWFLVDIVGLLMGGCLVQPRLTLLLHYTSSHINRMRNDVNQSDLMKQRPKWVLTGEAANRMNMVLVSRTYIL